MIIKINVSEVNSLAIEKIAETTEDVKLLEQLARADNMYVVKAVILNPATTNEIREKIYRLWQKKENKKWLMRALVTSPLNSNTIRSMVEKEAFEDEEICKKLVEQEDISSEDMRKIYEYVISDEVDKEFAETVLCTMAKRRDLSEQLANKLLHHSPKVGEIVAITYRQFLRVTLSESKIE